ncbi:MAG: hypothetical protein J5755_05060 [Clostridia bacterium]|nr:hypothetical protein [Clostridia bacterium]
MKRFLLSFIVVLTAIALVVGVCFVAVGCKNDTPKTLSQEAIQARINDLEQHTFDRSALGVRVYGSYAVKTDTGYTHALGVTLADLFVVCHEDSDAVTFSLRSDAFAGTIYGRDGSVYLEQSGERQSIVLADYDLDAEDLDVKRYAVFPDREDNPDWSYTLSVKDPGDREQYVFTFDDYATDLRSIFGEEADLFQELLDQLGATLTAAPTYTVERYYEDIASIYMSLYLHLNSAMPIDPSVELGLRALGRTYDATDVRLTVYIGFVFPDPDEEVPEDLRDYNPLEPAQSSPDEPKEVIFPVQPATPYDDDRLQGNGKLLAGYKEYQKPMAMTSNSTNSVGRVEASTYHKVMSDTFHSACFADHCILIFTDYSGLQVCNYSFKAYGYVEGCRNVSATALGEGYVAVYPDSKEYYEIYADTNLGGRILITQGTPLAVVNGNLFVAFWTSSMCTVWAYSLDTAQWTMIDNLLATNYLTSAPTAYRDTARGRLNVFWQKGESVSRVLQIDVSDLTHVSTKMRSDRCPADKLLFDDGIVYVGDTYMASTDLTRTVREPVSDELLTALQDKVPGAAFYRFVAKVGDDFVVDIITPAGSHAYWVYRWDTKVFARSIPILSTWIVRDNQTLIGFTGGDILELIIL